MAVRSKALVFDPSVVGIASSDPADSADVLLLCLLCVVQVSESARSRSLVQGSPTGCVCVCVLSDCVVI